MSRHDRADYAITGGWAGTREDADRRLKDVSSAMERNIIYRSHDRVALLKSFGMCSAWASQSQIDNYVYRFLRIPQAAAELEDDIKDDPSIMTLPHMSTFAMAVVRKTSKTARKEIWQGFRREAGLMPPDLYDDIPTTVQMTNPKENKDMYTTTAVRTIDGWVGQVLFDGPRHGNVTSRNEPLIVWQSEPFHEDIKNKDGVVIKTAQVQAEEEAIAKVDEVVAAAFNQDTRPASDS